MGRQRQIAKITCLAGLCSSSKAMAKNFQWKLGNGRSISFWEGVQFQDSPLACSLANRLPREEKGKKVYEYWDARRADWQWEELEQWWRPEMVRKFRVVDPSFRKTEKSVLGGSNQVKEPSLAKWHTVLCVDLMK